MRGRRLHGGILVADLRRRRYARIRAADKKPFAEWCQVLDDVEYLVPDLQESDACDTALEEAKSCYKLTADMSEMEVMENN